MNSDEEAGLKVPVSIFYRITSLPPPPPPPKDQGYRPDTANTRRFSRSTTFSTRRTIKYATWGRFRGTELSPQPSDDADDPLVGPLLTRKRKRMEKKHSEARKRAVLGGSRQGEGYNLTNGETQNWPQWKKELNLAALLFTTCLACATKTILIPVNAELAARYNIPYASATALTAAPLIVSAFAGLACVTAAKLFGKRPVYLVSAILLFVGTMWNMRTLDSFRECMAARVFQGLGWGAFDTLVLGSIYDTYFVSSSPLTILGREGGVGGVVGVYGT